MWTVHAPPVSVVRSASVCDTGARRRLRDRLAKPNSISSMPSTAKSGSNGVMDPAALGIDSVDTGLVRLPARRKGARRRCREREALDRWIRVFEDVDERSTTVSKPGEQLAVVGPCRPGNIGPRHRVSHDRRGPPVHLALVAHEIAHTPFGTRGYSSVGSRLLRGRCHQVTLFADGGNESFDVHQVTMHGGHHDRAQTDSCQRASARR